jgi:AraC family transcriptional regulator
MERRIETVKNLLLTTRLSLVEVANQCGFADQSALNRSFKRIAGESSRPVAQEQKRPSISSFCQD